MLSCQHICGFLEKSIKVKYIIDTDIENTLEHINFGGPMNLDMLARQGWRLLLSQSFLCAQIFRAKVFAKWITSCLLSKNQVVSVHGEVLFARRKHSKVVCLCLDGDGEGIVF
jgi:hypothetical protein